MDSPTPARSASPSRSRVTTSLLVAGAAAAPLWILTSLTQAATRTGYDLTRHPLSVLANGDLGWIQTANFVVAGLLALAGAVGLRRTCAGRPAGTWAPILLAVQGTGLMAAGIFRLDPLDGFPPGTPPGQPTSMSWQSIAHNVAGTCTFAAMIAVCFVLARLFRATGHRAWANCGRAAGIAFFAGLAWAYSGRPVGALTLLLGVAISWVWIATSLIHLPAQKEPVWPNQ